MTQELGLLDTIIKSLGAPGIIIIRMGGSSLIMAFIYSDHRLLPAENHRQTCS